MTASDHAGTDAAPRHPKLQEIVDSVAAVRERFAKTDPPIRSVHLSGPSTPSAARKKPGVKLRVWFLLTDQEKVIRAKENGLLPHIEEALAREFGRRGNPQREFSELVVDVASVVEHDWRRCVRKT